MKVLSVSLCVLFVVILCQGDTWSENALNKYVPKKCKFRGSYRRPGDVSNPRICEKVICSSNGWISGHNCSESVRPDCAPGQLLYPGKPFPDCCRRLYTCTRRNGAEYTVEDF